MKKQTTAQKCQALFNRNYGNQGRENWRRSSERGYAFFLGNQLTIEEFNELREKKMPTFTVNKMTPQIELMVYFLTARSPRWQAVGFDGTDTAVAQLHAKVAQYVWKISKGGTLMAQVARDTLTKSIGYIAVGIDPDLDNGLGEVVLETLEPWDVYVDPDSRDPFFQDASWILVSKEKTISQAVLDFPELSKEKLIKHASMGSEDNMKVDFESPTPMHTYDVDEHSDSEGDYEETIRYYELYEKKNHKFFNVYYRKIGEDGEPTLENRIMPESDFKKLTKTEELKNNIIESLPFYKTKYERSKVIGDIEVETNRVLPGHSCPIIPLCYRHTGNPYPMSATMDMMGKQEEINKAHQIMIHHANLSSSPRYMAEEGAISNPKEWEKNAATPGSVSTYNPDSQGNPPTAVQPLPLNSAFYEISRLGVSDMEYLSGMSSHMMGQGDYSGREPYRGLLARDDFGTRRIRGFASNSLNEFLNHLGVVVDEYARFLYTTEKTMQIVSPDDPESVEIFHLNKIGEEELTKFYDDSKTNYDINFVSGSTLLVNRWAELEEYMELYKNGIIDSETVLYKTDLPNKKEIIKKIGTIQKLQGQAEQLSEQLEEISSMNDKLESQLVAAKIENKVIEGTANVQIEEEKMLAEIREAVREAKKQGKDVEKAVNLKLRELELENKEEKIANKEKNTNNK